MKYFILKFGDCQFLFEGEKSIAQSILQKLLPLRWILQEKKINKSVS